ncbi:MAG: hypothetical protein H7329_12765 [Opitutaceae bacterium]|nr:hypothetical protein [Cytophagales bacterium]
MDKRTFEKIITTPSEISSEEAVLLEELIQEFPYCQMAHLLIANESYQKKSMHYPKKLRKASTYVLDRTVLHSLLNPKEINSDLIEAKEDLIEKKIVEEDISNLSLANKENIQLLSELEANIRDLKSKKEAFSLPQKLVNESHTLLITHVYKPKELLNDSKPESRLGEELIGGTNNLDLLIKYFQHQNKVVSNDQDKIIDLFINTQPKISSRSGLNLTESENVDLSIPSSELKSELITENFALILTKQNKIEKAIEVYKKLLLKYPDKSAYFGAKLNELESR